MNQKFQLKDKKYHTGQKKTKENAPPKLKQNSTLCCTQVRIANYKNSRKIKSERMEKDKVDKY